MNLGEIMEDRKTFLEVEFKDLLTDGFNLVTYDGNDIRVRQDHMHHPDDIKAEALDEYHNALCRYFNMKADECKRIWGSSSYKVISEISPYEFIKKLKDFDNTPKVGEVWASDNTGSKYIILPSKNPDEIRFIHINGVMDWTSRCWFYENCYNTGEICSTFAPLLEELKRFE